MKSAVIGLILLVTSALGAVAQQSVAGAALARAMVAVEAGDWAQAARDVAPAGQIGRDIVTWSRLRAGDGAFDEYIAFLKRRDDWPGLALMRKMGEANIPAIANPDQVIAYFAPQDPRTGTGALRLAAAYAAKGARGDAQAEIVRAWRSLSLTKEEEDAFLAKYAKLLAKHHRARQDMLLWRDLASEAERLNGLVGSDYRKLAQARIGLIKGAKGVGALIGAVPARLKNDPGLAYARFQWRLRNKLPDGAIALLMARSTSVKSLGKPEAWSNRRRALARQLMRDGQPKKAYAMAAHHFLTEGADFKDLEWLAGFIALTDLNDPATALRHFQRFRAGVDTPISLGRAGYWEGRAQEALGNGEAAGAAYAFAAEYQTSFYGQLAAEKAGIAMDARLVGRESYPDFRTTPHGDSSVLKAAELFHEAGFPLLFTRFTRQLAEILSAQERGALAQLALDLDEPYAAVYLAKYAARSGDVLMRPYFPVTDILSSHMPVPPELTLSIVRRESEFYPGATSPVGARGLMQLMPKTGKAMAKRLNVPFQLDRLITDPAYNADLGSAYLGKLQEEFGPYYPFVAAGYNAGPSRPKRWMQQFGDPRRSPEAAVDWIEHIPFRETRNYVMRVMESLAVYRARLSGKTGPWRLSRDLMGR